MISTLTPVVAACSEITKPDTGHQQTLAVTFIMLEFCYILGSKSNLDDILKSDAFENVQNVYNLTKIAYCYQNRVIFKSSHIHYNITVKVVSTIA